MSESRINKVLIVGAGLGGLSLALALRRAGIKADLVEIDSELHAAGAGLTLNGASLCAFATLGLLEEIQRLGHSHDVRRTFDGKGKLLFHRCPDFHPVLQQRFLANALRWLTT